MVPALPLLVTLAFLGLAIVSPRAPWAVCPYHTAGTRALSCRSQKMRLHCGSQHNICTRPTCIPTERTILQGFCEWRWG